MRNTVSFRNHAIRGLSGSVDIVGKASLSNPVGMKTEAKNRELCLKNRLPVKNTNFLENAVDLVIPSHNDPQLLKFAGKLYETLQEQDNYGSILGTACSWAHGAVIKILIRTEKLSNLVINLANMPEVERVEETLVRDDFRNFANISETMTKPGTSNSKKIQIIMKENGMAGSNLTAAALN